jgi:hypothetical protein
VFIITKDLKKCYKCKEVKPLNEFYTNSSKKDGYDDYCKSCRKLQVKGCSSYIKKYVDHNKELVNSLKTPCRKCGETRHYLIQFHHVDPSEKKFTVSLYGTRSEVKIREEASKCVCLCSNCHDEFHYLYGKNPKNPVESLMEYLGER